MKKKTFKLISGLFYIVTDSLVSFTFERCEGSSNVKTIGYSEALRQLFIEFNNDKRYIYNDVPKHIWDKWQAEKVPGESKFGVFLAANIKGSFSYAEVTEEASVIPSTAEAVMEQMGELSYYHDTSAGLWAIDQDPGIVDLDWIRRNAFQIK